MSILPPSSRSGLREVFRNGYMVVRHDPTRKLVVLTRSAAPYASLEDLRATFAGMDAALVHVSRPRTALIVDSRKSPARNDPAFEAEFTELRKKFNADFRKISILVQTAVGVLQVGRHARMDDTPMGIFTNPGEALAYAGVHMDPGRLDLHD
jgi:hypothetical protein